jgi:hypothetical protein
MTRVVRLARTTRRLHRLWSAAAVSAAAGAGGLAVFAGGSSMWLRIVLVAVALERCHAAIGHRTSLTPFVVAVTVALVIVPIDARLDRTLVSALGGVLVVAAAECAHVARRLATVAPIDETRRDLVAVATSVGAGALAVVITIAVAQLDRWPNRWFAAGAVLAALGIAVLAGTSFPGRRRAVTGGD